MSTLKYKRILLKLSGEALAGPKGYGLDPQIVGEISDEIVRVHQLGVEIGIVIGGGNIVRGVQASSQGIDRTAADQMGMLATVMNCIAMQDALEKRGVVTRVQSALTIDAVCEPFIKRRATRHLEKNRLVLFAAGTGNPFFSTDTAGALRANEIGADVIMKATKVDGIYDKDPMKHDDAVRFDQISYTDAINRGLAVMDTAALALCRENKLPILVFRMGEGNLERVVRGEDLGTLVTE